MTIPTAPPTVNYTAVQKMADDLLSSAVDKVILIGDVGVGKTSIFTRFRTGNFESSADQKIAEFQKKWTVNGRDLSVSIKLCVVLIQP